MSAASSLAAQIALIEKKRAVLLGLTQLVISLERLHASLEAVWRLKQQGQAELTCRTSVQTAADNSITSLVNAHQANLRKLAEAVLKPHHEDVLLAKGGKTEPEAVPAVQVERSEPEIRIEASEPLVERVEPVFTDLLAGHSRRMAAIGLDA